MTPSVSPALPYVDFATFLQRHFPGQKVQKITLTAGFSCPTRDGSMGKGGCTYCNNKSFSPNYATKLKSITEQIDEGIAFFRRKYPEMKYLAYFQSYTNTYGEVEDCIAKYEEALRHEDVVGLIIGTRPDCMPQPLLDYLKELSKRTFLLVEYGVESTCDRSLERIQRGTAIRPVSRPLSAPTLQASSSELISSSVSQVRVAKRCSSMPTASRSSPSLRSRSTSYRSSVGRSWQVSISVTHQTSTSSPRRSISTSSWTSFAASAPTSCWSASSRSPRLPCS